MTQYNSKPTEERPNEAELMKIIFAEYEPTEIMNNSACYVQQIINEHRNTGIK